MVMFLGLQWLGDVNNSFLLFFKRLSFRGPFFIEHEKLIFSKFIEYLTKNNKVIKKL